MKLKMKHDSHPAGNRKRCTARAVTCTSITCSREGVYPILSWQGGYHILSWPGGGIPYHLLAQGLVNPPPPSARTGWGTPPARTGWVPLVRTGWVLPAQEMMGYLARGRDVLFFPGWEVPILSWQGVDHPILAGGRCTQSSPGWAVPCLGLEYPLTWDWGTPCKRHGSSGSIMYYGLEIGVPPWKEHGTSRIIKGWMGYPPGVDWQTNWTHCLPNPLDAGGNYRSFISTSVHKLDVDKNKKLHHTLMCTIATQQQKNIHTRRNGFYRTSHCISTLHWIHRLKLYPAKPYNIFWPCTKRFTKEYVFHNSSSFNYILTQITTTTNPRNMTTDWNTSVQMTAFIPPYKNMVMKLLLDAFQIVLF